MKKINIEYKNIQFKNLLSGPAPVGRILNYLYLVGTTGLKHKNVNRQTNLQGGIGDAWCTEFMIGLGLIKLGAPVGTAFKLELTSTGYKLFNLMKDNYVTFNEGISRNDLSTVKQQMDNCDPAFYDVFREIFVNTYPFLILKEYLNENGYSYNSSNKFTKDFFEEAAKLYEDDAREAGFNRVPSLIQLCKIFGFAEWKKGVVFVKSAFENSNLELPIYEFDEQELIEEASVAEKIYDLSSEALKKYGADGNVTASGVVRDPELQKKFKNNLSIEQDHKCVICGLKTEKLLIGSHIKPSANCNVHEKADTQNGLLLCANHDKLFDRYLISFNPQNGKIVINEKQIKDKFPFLKLDINFVLPNNLLTNKRKQYLEIHYQEFLRRNKSN